jgi:ubiquinone/menaquinone biosynthesis C-methylase UbiE
MNIEDYLMENTEESIRLDLKTDPKSLKKQALWAGIRSGMRVTDIGCGPGKTSTILSEIVRSLGKSGV